MTRILDTGSLPTAPDEPALEDWGSAEAVGPDWRPEPGQHHVVPVRGALLLHAGGLEFRAADVVDHGTGKPLRAWVAGTSIRDAGPFAPGADLAPGHPAGTWLPWPLRRMRVPGFGVATDEGGWAFGCPHGSDRAAELRRRFADRS